MASEVSQTTQMKALRELVVLMAWHVKTSDWPEADRFKLEELLMKLGRRYD